MFDVGFSELLVIGIVALVVIGPEKLPRVARTVGALLGRMQRYVNDVKADISREIELDELKKMQTTVQDAASSIQTSMNETVAGFQSQADELNKIATGDVSGLMDTKPGDTAADIASAPAETPALTAADAAVPAVSAESASVSATASTSTSATMPVAPASADVSPGTVVESGSHQTSQASLFAESAAPNHARSAADSAADTGVTSKPAATV